MRNIVTTGTVVLSLFLSSCAEHQNDSKLFIAVRQSMEDQINRTNYYTQLTYRTLENKLQETTVHEKAKLWKPKAERVMALTRKVHSYLDPIQTNREKDPAVIYSVLVHFEKELDSIAPHFREIIDKNPVMPAALEIHSEDRFRKFYQANNNEDAAIFLTQLRLQVKSTENRLVNLCNEQVTGLSFIHDHPFPFINQSSMQVMPGEEIILNAGMAKFSRTVEVTFGTSKVKLENSQGTYAFRAPDKTGKYEIPVTIAFFDEDGNKQTARKNVEYTVRKCN